MIAIDTNVLVCAHREEMPLHAPALERLRMLAEGGTPWALPIFCVEELVRVVTHPRVFHPPTDLETALAFLDQVLGSPSARMVLPGPTFPARFAEACRDGAVQGKISPSTRSWWRSAASTASRRS
ncbi:MAG: VapC toxin family PIN domain ribonuclease [Deltaproteobacteria bacterium]|nr:VapC toxin family PIN domain ribonuclease [Deltaproteobacteria bacterium]